MSEKKKESELYDLIGGRATLDKVHKIFYDKIYSHSWIGKYFQEVKQDIIEAQQSDFMAQAMGGPKMYSGKFPIPAHRHMYITDELFELRTQLLRESLIEASVSLENQVLWLKIDDAFRSGIVKKSRADCSLRFNTDEILDYPNPIKKSA